MKKIVFVTAAVIAMASMAQADSCHILNAGEDQKMACAEAKFNAKVMQLEQVASSIKSELREIAGRKDDASSDTAERAARTQKLKLALKGINAELKEAAANTKTFLRGAVSRQDDAANDAAERAAREAKIKEIGASIEAKLQRKLSQFGAFLKSVHDSVDKD